MEPERPIEKLLRAFSKKRRDELGAPMEMHPATKRALQAEVARQFPRKDRRGLLSSLTQFWPRFAWATALIIAIGLAATLWFENRRPNQPGFTMAKNDRLPLSQSQGATTASPTALSGEAVTDFDKRTQPALVQKLKNKNALEEQNKGFAAGDVRSANEVALRTQTEKKLESAPSATPLASTRDESARGALTLAESVQSPPVDSEAFRRKYGLTRNSAVNIQTNAASVAAESLVLAQRRDELAAKNQPATRVREAGRQNAPANSLLPSSTVTHLPALTPSAESRQLAGVAGGGKLAEPAKPSAASRLVASQKFAAVGQQVGQSRVESDAALSNQPLTSFVVQQIGTELRIIDQDGSVYVGFAKSSDVSDLAKENKGASRALGAPAANTELSTRPTASSNKDSSGVLFFQVVGTNQTLKQKVVFTGNLWPRAATATTGLTTNNAPAQDSFGEDPAVRLSTTRIIGKVRIGTGGEIDIDAVPARQ